MASKGSAMTPKLTMHPLILSITDDAGFDKIS